MVASCPENIQNVHHLTVPVCIWEEYDNKTIHIYHTQQTGSGGGQADQDDISQGDSSLFEPATAVFQYNESISPNSYYQLASNQEYIYCLHCAWYISRAFRFGLSTDDDRLSAVQ